MTKKLASAQFDYSIVDDGSKSKLIWLAGEINKQKSTGLKSMLEMGKAVAEAQTVLADHAGGTFGKWIESECGIAKRSAYNYMNAWRRFGGCASLAQLTAEAMYLLSEPKAPKSAASQAAKLADQGIRVTKKIAQDLLGPPPENGAPRKADKADGTDFDTAKMGKAEPAKPPRNAKPTVSTKKRSECLSLHAKLCRALQAVGIYDEFIQSLSQIAERLKQI